MNIVYGKSIQPKILVGDAAPIRNGFGRNGFGRAFGDDNVTTMCRFHVVLNFHKRAFNNPNDEIKMKEDLRQLQTSYSKEVFDIGKQLFLQKWSETEPEFTSNFETQYLQRNPNWFNGATKRAPKTNNCLERFNGTLKQHQTFYERKTLAVFKDDLMDIVSARSVEYIANKTFQHEVEMDKKVQAYSKSNKSMFVESGEDGFMIFFVFSGASEELITEQEVRECQTHEYSSFDEFKEKAFRIYEITFPHNPAEWKDATCTCPSFFLNYICKHIVGIAYRLNILVEEKQRKKADQPLEWKKRGRPKKATSALVID